MELMFLTRNGPVLAMAELLSPCSATPIGLQPFRFIAWMMLSCENYPLQLHHHRKHNKEVHLPRLPVWSQPTGLFWIRKRIFPNARRVGSRSHCFCSIGGMFSEDDF